MRASWPWCLVALVPRGPYGGARLTALVQHVRHEVGEWLVCNGARPMEEDGSYSLQAAMHCHCTHQSCTHGPPAPPLHPWPALCFARIGFPAMVPCRMPAWLP